MDYLQMLRMRNLFDPTQQASGISPDDGSGMTGNMPPLFGGSMDSGNLGGPRTPSPFDDIQFGNTHMPAPGVPALGDSSDNYDPGARMKELFHPSHIATDKFDQMIGQYPTRTEPSKMRRFAGAALGALSAIGDPTIGPMGGPPNHEMGHKVYDDITGKTDFNEKVQDWKNQVGPLGTAANMERYQNTNERQTAYQTISAELRDHAQELKAKNDNRKADIAEHRANIYDMKSRGYKFDFSGPTIMATRPDDPNPKDTGIPTGHMTQLDKLNLEAENKANAIDESGRQSRLTEGVKEGNREKLADKKGWSTANIPDPTDPTRMIGVRINNDTGEVKPIQLGGENVGAVQKPSSGAGAANKPETPAQTKIRQFNAATKLFNTDPELRQFIKLGPGANEFSLVTPGKSPWMGTPTGPNMSQMKKLNESIYGGSKGPIQGTEMDLSGNTPVNKPNMGTEPLTHGNDGSKTGGAQQHVSEVPPESRQVGQIYIMGNGKPGKWLGHGFEAVQ